jgi:glycosyltransferase involved in cell wall biosynthesis
MLAARARSRPRCEVAKAVQVLMVTPALPTETEARTTAFIARQIKSLRDAGVTVDLLEIRGRSKAKYPQAIAPLRKLAHHVDVIHAHYGFPGWIARSQLRRPVVVSFLGSDLLYYSHASPVADGLHRLEITSSRLLARLVDAVIVKSPEMAAKLPFARTYVVPNGVDLAAFAPRDRAEARTCLGWSRDRVYVLFPGNPAQRRKAFPLARDAVERASQLLGRPIELVPLRGIPPAHVPLMMNASDAMILTSLAEGSPNVVKEAMACNLPVVSVPVGDAEWLLDGVRGCGVEPRDVEPLGAALAKVLAARQPSDGRRALLEKGLDERTVAGKIVGVYEDVLSRRNRYHVTVD